MKTDSVLKQLGTFDPLLSLILLTKLTNYNTIYHTKRLWAFEIIPGTIRELAKYTEITTFSNEVA